MVINIRYVVLLFFLSLFFYTPFNYAGITPLPLIIASILFFINLLKSMNIKLPKFNLLDYSLFGFLIYLLLNYLINYNETLLNLNHLYAYFAVIIFYYFTLRISIFNYLEDDLITIAKYLSLGLLLILLIGILDYILLQNKLFTEDFLPITQANKVSGIVYSLDGIRSTIWARPRGFFTEPTILAYAVISMAPIAIAYSYYYKSNISYFIYFFLFTIIIILTRSAAGIYSLFLALLITRIIFINNIKISFKIRHINLFLLVLFVFFISLLVYFFRDDVMHFISVLYGKLVFVNSETLSISAIGRTERWFYTLYYYTNSDFLKIVFGYGPGYESAGGLEGGTTASWFLNILLDYGIIGFLLIITAFFGAAINILKKNNEFQFWLMVSLLFCAINLFTHTGFYFPFVWLIFILTNLTINGKK